MRAAAALLLASCVAGFARAEGDALERGAQAGASLEERLKARARTIPGTEIRYVFAGYLQLDALWTRRALSGDEQGTFLASAIPFDAAGRDARIGARASQFNLIVQSPTQWGEFTALAQADLFDYGRGARPNLTQLVARAGEWLAVGKTYSTFMDDSIWPSTLDYNGPGGAVFVRQLVLRGGVPLAQGWRLEAAVEDPQANVSAGGPAFSVSGSAERPDLVARLRYDGERLHAQLAGISRSATYSAQLASTAGASRRISGYGISASAGAQMAHEDRLVAQWTQGEGIGRYFNDGLSGVGAVYNAGAGLEPLRLSGAFLYYERKWAERWTSTAGVSALRAESDGLRPPSDLRRADYASMNLVHRLTADLFLGAEVLWGRARRQDGTEASDSRIQISVRYLLY